jgi:hypothetical protein
LPSDTIFFTDQCLAGQAISQAIAQASGCRTEIFAAHVVLDAKDVVWLPEIGRRGWVLVTKDWRIQERPLEREAIISAKVRAFVLRQQNLSGKAIIALLKLAMPNMLSSIAKYAPPFIFALEISGELTPLSELLQIAHE